MARRHEHTVDTETSYFVPNRGWLASETPEATIQLVNEKVYSFSEYNNNTFYRRGEDGEWIRMVGSEVETLSGVERGHCYTLTPRSVTLRNKDQDAYRITAPRAPDEETEKLLKGLTAWSVIPHYGERFSVICFDRHFYVMAQDLPPFRERVEGIGGQVVISTVELSELLELSQQIEEKAAQISRTLGETHSLVESLSANSPQTLEELEQMAGETRERVAGLQIAYSALQSKVGHLQLESGRLVDKARGMALEQDAAGRIQQALQGWEQMKQLTAYAQERFAALLLGEEGAKPLSPSGEPSQETIASVLEYLGVTETQLHALSSPQETFLQVLAEWHIPARQKGDTFLIEAQRHIVAIGPDGVEITCPAAGRWQQIRV